MAILSLVKQCNEDTVEVLECLLSLARRGELRGTSIYYRDISGHEDAIFTGMFRNNAEALKAAMLTSMFLTRQEEQARSKP